MKQKLTTIALSALSLTAMAAEKQPNVLVVITDEHNFRTIGAYRDLLPKEAAEPWGAGVVVDTPNIDYLASQGALCSSFYSPSPVSSPARSSLVSGMYPSTTKVIVNDVHMDDNIETFAQTLLNRGYATGYAGKWHLDGDSKPGWAPKAKFGFEDNRYMFNRGHWKVLGEDVNGPLVAMNDKGQNLPALAGDEKSFTTDFLTDRALDFIKQNSDKPFCYMLSIPDPHTPNTVRKPYNTQYADQKFENPVSSDVAKINAPEWFKALGNATRGNIISQSPEMIACYWGMVKCIDDNIGRLITTLKDEGIFDNTIIVFTSDHGDMLGEHFKDNKGISQEGSAKVPFIIYAPGKIKAKSVVPFAMNSVDFTPTLFSLMGVNSGIDYEGRDCSKLLEKNKLPKGWNNTTVMSWEGWIAATDGRYKLTCMASENGGIDMSKTPVLFDLESDPLEMNSIYGDPSCKEVTDKLMREVEKYRDEHWRRK